MNNNENNGFQYNYSAKEQAELKKIREKYITDTKSSEMSTMEKIKKLDSGVTKKGTVIALIIGILGTLIMGVGMSLIMTDIGSILGAYSDKSLVIGIVIGLAGMLGVVAAYPVYQCVISKERKKIAPEILSLTDELIENGDLSK